MPGIRNPVSRKDRVFPERRSKRTGLLPGSSAPWSPALALVGFVGLCLLVGAADGAVTASSVRGLVPVAHGAPGHAAQLGVRAGLGVLYVLMGVAAWLVWRQRGASRAIRLWGWQLLLNALWTPAFFGLHSPILGLVVIVPLLALLALTIQAFVRISRAAAWMLVPYLAWTAYATYLNAGFWWLNQA